MNETITILEFLVASTLLWVLWHFGWKQYQLDQLRQTLFALRDELFLLVGKKEVSISFNDKAYVEWRRYFNIAIKYSHLITFNRIVIGNVLSKFPIWGANLDLKNFKTSAELTLDQFDDENLKKRLLDLRTHASVAFLKYLLLTSPLFAFLLLVTLGLLALAIPFLGLILYIRNAGINIKEKLGEIKSQLSKQQEILLRVLEAEAEVTSDQLEGTLA